MLKIMNRGKVKIFIDEERYMIETKLKGQRLRNACNENHAGQRTIFLIKVETRNFLRGSISEVTLKGFIWKYGG